MNPIVQTPETLAVARRVVWFKEPHDALRAPTHFLAHVMTYGTPRDVKALAGIVTREDYRTALEHAPAGVFDARSWAYWHLVCDVSSAPALPQRKIT